MKKYFFVFFILTSTTVYSQKTTTFFINQAVELYNNADIAAAAANMEDALNAAKRELGEEHPMYYSILNKLNFMYIASGQLDKAKIGTIESYNKILEKYGKENELFVEAVQILSLYDRETGNISALDSLLHMRENFYEKNTVQYLTYRNDLAEYKRSIGQYAEAEQIYLDLLPKYKKLVGENEYYALINSNLGLLYFSLNLFDKAETYFNHTLKIFDSLKKYDKRHYNIVKANLASVYTSQKKLSEAINILYQLKQDSNKENIEYGNVLYSFGYVLSLLGKWPEAQQYFSEAMTFTEKKIGKNNHLWYSCVNGMADVYYNTNELEKAKKLYFDNSQYLKNKYGIYYPHYVTTITNLAAMYYITHDFEQALPLFSEALYTSGSIIKTNIAFLTEKEQLQYIHDYVNTFESFQNFVYDFPSRQAKTTSILLDQILFYKKLLLFNTLSIRKFVETSNNAQLIEEYSKLSELKLEIAHLYSGGNNLKKIKQLQLKADELEKETYQLINNLYPNKKLDQQINATNNFNEIANTLEKDECVIEFTKFQRFQNRNWNDTVYYAALIVKKNMDQLDFIYLFKEDELLDLLKKKQNERDIRYINKLYTEKGNELYELIWSKIEPYLKHVKKIYLSPVGILHNIAFEALPYKKNKVLLNKYKIKYVENSRQIIDQTPLFFEDIKSIHLFGDIAYDVNIDSLEIAVSKYEKNESVSRAIQTDKSRGLVLSPLSGAKEELQLIEEICLKKNKTVERYAQLNASEEAFKHVSTNNSNIIHIATHGYYFPNNNKKNNLGHASIEQYAQTNSLLNSGLFMAGAQQSINGTAYTKIDDGILNSYEISTLNLNNTKLVVLSACQTGLGNIKGYEGVEGLSRAFKLAGVENIIVSLWNINDEAAKKFMGVFYKKFARGLEVNEAFRKAQKALAKDFSYDYPYFWAAFKLLN